ncbi:13854_t:CDS:10 [Entrophospora sp. SA101]|nr:13854_t:CDS:10 [Entrophospora sp. SA101]
MDNEGKRQVLPTNVRPTNYNLILTPDLKEFTHKGTEVVNLDINENTNKITLNVIEIEIQSATIENLSLNTISSQKATDISYDKGTVTLTFQKEIIAGTKAALHIEFTAALHIEFTGILNDKMTGFYRSSYVDESGNKRYLVTTQFEATDARRAFPCWDEPAIKATFDITLIVPSELTALSNMNVISEKPLADGKKEVMFAKTPIMSTYLLAFVVGDLAYIEKKTNGKKTNGVKNAGNPVQIRVYATRGNEKNGEFALNVAVEVLEYFAGVFGIPYPLPKLDMVAIPDFEAGKNWGLITYRTAAILFDTKQSDAKFKQRIGYTVSHELAHQDLLLGLDIWLLIKSFLIGIFGHRFQKGLQLDSLKSSHPIEVPVNNPSEIHQIFDAISYYKGASVIRMLSDHLGENIFLIVKEARRRFDLLTKHNDESAIHPNIRGTVFDIVLKYGGGEEEFNAIIDIYRKTTIPDQKIIVLASLGSVVQPELIQRSLDFAISDEVKEQDIIYSFSGYAKSVVLFGHVIKFCISSFASEEDIKDIESFFKDKDCKNFARPLQQSLESIRINAAWVNRDADDVKQWLKENKYLE